MLALTSPAAKAFRFCDGISRRNCLTLGGSSLLAVSLSGLLRAGQTADPAAPSLINIFLAGGPPHQDMFDLKPNAPSGIRGEFRPIDTNVAGMQICEHMPELAKLADKLVLVRGLRGATEHHAATICNTGWSLPAVEREGHPSIGAVVSKYFRDRQVVPPFLSLAQPTRHAPWGQPGQPGFLGAGHAAVCPSDEVVKCLTAARDAPVNRRRALAASLEALHGLHSRATADMDDVRQRAFELLNSPNFVRALDYSEEPEREQRLYAGGSLNPVDDGAPAWPLYFLIAARLIEAGARVVDIVYGRWDWHTRNFAQGKQYLPVLSRGLAALIERIYSRGLPTVILLWGEFGRTPRINKDAGRDHWTAASCALLSGLPLQTGQILGSTDAQAASPAPDSPSYPDIVATVYRHLGIDPARPLADRLGRPHMPVNGGTIITGMLK
jgi:hypothetical protein